MDYRDPTVEVVWIELPRVVWAMTPDELAGALLEMLTVMLAVWLIVAR